VISYTEADREWKREQSKGWLVAPRMATAAGEDSATKMDF
jgi:hypothetical protein